MIVRVEFSRWVEGNRVGVRPCVFGLDTFWYKTGEGAKGDSDWKQSERLWIKHEQTVLRVPTPSPYLLPANIIHCDVSFNSRVIV